MPSPVGHALGGVIVGLAAGWGQTPRLGGQSPRSAMLRLGILAAAACAPDLDFLWGRHGAETHSVGAAVVAALATLALTRGRDVGLAVAVGLAWSTHVL